MIDFLISLLSFILGLAVYRIYDISFAHEKRDDEVLKQISLLHSGQYEIVSRLIGQKHAKKARRK